VLAGTTDPMRILLAEDDQETASFVGRGLHELGHNIVAASNGVDALHFAQTEALDVAVLDRMLPGLDGIAIVRALRGQSSVLPIILLTALGRVDDRVLGLEAGADDYLTKPFAMSELAARINAVARRGSSDQRATCFTAGDLSLDLLTREVRRGDKLVPLQPREFRLLEELIRNAGKFVTRTMLLERVWDFHFDPQTKIVETHMSRLRAKLNFGGLDDLIETVRGVGYRLKAD
jgi:two-component system OmpR family response regulator